MASSKSLKRVVCEYNCNFWIREAETEVWDLENDTMEMITPELKNYEYGIALYVVDSNFCKK